MKPRKKYELIATTFRKNGTVIATGRNEYNKTHPLSKHFALQSGESEHKDKIHAELNAVLKSNKNRIFSILVQRFNKDGSTANAKPCLSCQNMLRAFGVRIVNYTTEKGIEQYENI
jgi:deoxycytidylate deaminase